VGSLSKNRRKAYGLFESLLTLAVALFLCLIFSPRQQRARLYGKVENGKVYVRDLQGGYAAADRVGDQLYVNGQWVGEVVSR
jgi:hypothetical protein